MKTILSLIICIVILHKIWKLDLYDRTHPYGLDNLKNKKYTPYLVGEEYGVHVYTGIPLKTDNITNMINKIEWLSESYKRDVSWRLSLCFGIIGTIVLLTLINIDYFSQPRIILSSIMVFTIIIYFFRIYRNFHIEHYKSFYIKKHIRRIKKYLNLKSKNNLLDSL